MKRVVYAWNYLEWGGAQIHFLALIKEVRKRFEVIVILPEGSSPQFLSFLDELGISYQFTRRHMELAPAPTIRRKIEKHWRKFRSEIAMVGHISKVAAPDSIVHVDLSPQQSLLALALLSLRTRVFTTSHNALPKVGPLRDLVWRFKFRAISLLRNFNVFCSNNDARDYFRKYYSRRVGDRIRVTYTSINPVEIGDVLSSPFDRSVKLSELSIPVHVPIVLAVGQFIDRKGRWIFLEAASKVLKETDALFLWLTPTLPDASDLETIEEYGVGEAFRIVLSKDVGIRRRDILSFFRVADVFALPSYVEGLPIALLEAMALGVPSVSTNVNGIPEAIIDEETGLLVAAGDAEALSKAIIRLLKDKQLSLKIGAAGRKFAIERFDEQVAATTVLNTYLEK